MSVQALELTLTRKENSMEAIPLHKQLAMGKPYPKSVDGKKMVDTAKNTGREDSPKKVKMPKGKK